MPLDDRREDLIIAVALADFSVSVEPADAELSEQAWQLAADRLVEYGLEPEEVVDELEIGES